MKTGPLADELTDGIGLVCLTYLAATGSSDLATVSAIVTLAGGKRAIREFRRRTEG